MERSDKRNKLRKIALFTLQGKCYEVENDRKSEWRGMHDR